MLLFRSLTRVQHFATHQLQHSKLPCPYPPRVCSKSCPLCLCRHPSISFSVVPFSFCAQSFPASGSFPMIWLFASGDQSIAASASVLPMNIQGWFPLELTGLISLHSKGLSIILAITIHIDFGAQENKICHCFFFSPFYLPWSDGTRCHNLSLFNIEFQASFFHSPL